MNNPTTDETVTMYYLNRPNNNDCIIVEVKRFKVGNGDGYVSPRDILLKLDIDIENSDISMRSRNGVGSELMIDGLGTFKICSGENVIDRPIFSYVDRNGLTRYVASPNFENLVVRIA